MAGVGATGIGLHDQNQTSHGDHIGVGEVIGTRGGPEGRRLTPSAQALRPVSDRMGKAARREAMHRQEMAPQS